MRWKIAQVLLPILMFVVGVLWSKGALPQRQVPSVRPATVERMQNLELEADKSRRPSYIPPEWGRLVSVQRLNDLKIQLFLQSESGDIYLVRLTQQGEYLFLDTTDNGGVSLVIRRQP